MSSCAARVTIGGMDRDERLTITQKLLRGDWRAGWDCMLTEIVGFLEPSRRLSPEDDLPSRTDPLASMPSSGGEASCSERRRPINRAGYWGSRDPGRDTTS